MVLLNASSVSAVPDFEHRFCARFGVAPERFRAVALRRTLYPHARLLRPVLEWFAPEFFAADRDFVAGVARLGRRRDFKAEVWDFLYNPANRGFLRRRLRLRISVQRTQRLVESLLAEPGLPETGFRRAPNVDPAPET